MKIFKNNSLLIILLLLWSIAGHAGPPAPGPPNTPEYPIDQNIKILIIIAILYGSYKIYKHIQNKKASI
jgi:hypothetical protein